MKRRFALVVPLALATAAPAAAEPVTSAFVYEVHAIHLNVFRPLGAGMHVAPAAASQEAAPEVSLLFGKFTSYLDHGGEAMSHEEGCVDILVGSVIDAGCGALTIIPDGLMNVTRVTGTIESTEYLYTSDPFSIDPVGPSTITVDLTFTAAGPPGLSPYGSSALGFCGLPPSTHGVFAQTLQEVARTSVGTGTLTSAAAGDVSLEGFEPLMIEAVAAGAGVCT